jgi:CRP-like cAMP-binding protein
MPNKNFESAVAPRAAVNMNSRRFDRASQDLSLDDNIDMTASQVSQNAFLATLPPEVLLSFKQMELIRLPEDLVLFECGSTGKYTYFPLSAIVSLQYAMQNGSYIEIAVVGPEGLVGTWLAMGERSMCRAVVQNTGYGYRLQTQHFIEAITKSGVLASLLMPHINALLSQIALQAVSARLCSVEQQLCRWLLDRLDRLPWATFKVTHERIALMLGVRRESISEAAQKLQRERLIKYSRGKIEVLDRQSLARFAGECYQSAGISSERADLMAIGY